MSNVEAIKLGKPTFNKKIIVFSLLSLMLDTAIFLSFALYKGFFLSYAFRFFVVSLVFHCLLAIISGSITIDFRNISILQQSLKLSMVPSVFFIIMASKDYHMPYITISIMLVMLLLDVDYSKKNTAKNDAALLATEFSEFLFLFVISFVLYYFNIMVFWFFITVMCGLCITAIVVLWSIIVKNKVYIHNSKLKKAAYWALMFVYGFNLLKLVANIAPWIFTVANMLVLLLFVISIVSIILFSYKDIADGL